MHKYQWLRICADEFKKQLEEYAKTDVDVARFLKIWMPLYEKIQRREIRLPYRRYGGNIEFYGNDEWFPLVRKYGVGAPKNSLRDAESKFSDAINDDFSDKWYCDRLKERGGKNPVDEPPPPEEETPLPPPPPLRKLPWGRSKPIPWWRVLSNKIADGLFAFLKNVCG
jgi:hypothetical protein